MTWALALGACSPGGGKPVDAAIFDVPQDLTIGELPPGCPPGIANDVGVGKPCTPGGKECNGTKATQCTCDTLLGFRAPAGTPCFCTAVAVALACPAQNTCGKDASCCAYTVTGMPVGNLCVPNICLAEHVCPAYLNQ
jgi:hypothetical protein